MRKIVLITGATSGIGLACAWYKSYSNCPRRRGNGVLDGTF